MNFNKIFIGGNLVKDPELTTKNEKSRTNFTIAQTINDVTQFYNCVAYGKIADNIVKYFKKGNAIFIEGSLNVSYKDKNGDTKYYTIINVFSFQFVDGKTNNLPKSKNSENTDGSNLPF